MEKFIGEIKNNRKSKNDYDGLKTSIENGFKEHGNPLKLEFSDITPFIPNIENSKNPTNNINYQFTQREINIRLIKQDDCLVAIVKK